MRIVTCFAICLVLASVAVVAEETDIMDKVEHHYADSSGVKIHYATLGEGPLVVMIHGFPDFWYSWHHQMAVLSENYRVAAVDLRGYNESDKPKGVEQYDMTLLVGDIAAVIRDAGEKKAVIVGHDWGGAIAWQFAMSLPEMTDKLIIVNLPHPKGMARELANNAEQQKNSQYARDFQKEDAHKTLNAAMLAGFVARGDADLRAKYEEAFNNSDFEAMLNYYKQNYPRTIPSDETAAESSIGNLPVADMPKVTVPVLQFHGLNDTALHHHGLNNTWEELEKDYTLVTIPGVGHWAHHEAADLVTTTMKWWLLSRR